jgi:hypothetical protein
MTISVTTSGNFLLLWRCKVRQRYRCNRPWRPIGLWNVEAPTFSRQSAHRWWWGCQPYAPVTLYPQEDSWYSFLLEAESTPGHSAAGRIRWIEKFNYLIGNRTRDHPACGIVPQPTTLARAPLWRCSEKINFFNEGEDGVISDRLWWHLLLGKSCTFECYPSIYVRPVQSETPSQATKNSIPFQSWKARFS